MRCLRRWRLARAAVFGWVAAAWFAGPASAQGEPFPDGPLGNEAVATTDDATGFLINPAAGGYRHESQLQFTYGEREDPDDTKHRILQGLGHYRGFALAATQVRDDQRELRLAARTGGAFSLGIAGRWRMSERTGDHVTDWTLGTLMRPLPWLSLGGTLEHPAQPKFDGVRMTRVYTAGIGWRPLAMARSRAFVLGPRLTLSADAQMEEGASLDAARLRWGAEVELVPGIAVRGAIENPGGVRIGLGISSPRATWHLRGDPHDDGVPRTRSVTLAVHSNEERTVLAGRTARRVAVMKAGGRRAADRIHAAGR
jgi:hypothetical protein